MKRTFYQIAQTIINNNELSSSDYRTVLHWFGSPSLYFPTEQEKKRAQDAFVWMYQNIFDNECVLYNIDSRMKCIELFSGEFALSKRNAERLFDDYISKCKVPRPTIICIEGLDGSGKTIQSNKLRNILEEKGKDVCVIDFPQYTSFFGKEIGSLLSGAGSISAMELDEKSMCLWYAIDRWKTISEAQLEQYDYVIFNRYTLSSVVYQSARKYNGFNREFANWIFELEHAQLALPVPDIYIYLDTRVEFCGKNVLRKGKRGYVAGLDVYEKSHALLSCCHNIYKSLSDEIQEIVVLGCVDDSGEFKSVEEVSANIIESLIDHGLYL